jgi:hypothetical protein
MRHEQRSIQQLLTDNVLQRQAAPVALTTATNTISAAGIIGGLITINGGTAGAVTSTLVTAALLDTALIALFGGMPVDYSVDFSIINLSVVAAEDATVTTAAGWTLVGNMVVESNEATAQKGPSAAFRARKTANNTYTLYRIA